MVVLFLAAQTRMGKRIASSSAAELWPADMRRDILKLWLQGRESSQCANWSGDDWRYWGLSSTDVYRCHGAGNLTRGQRFHKQIIIKATFSTTIVDSSVPSGFAVATWPFWPTIFLDLRPQMQIHSWLIGLWSLRTLSRRDFLALLLGYKLMKCGTCIHNAQKFLFRYSTKMSARTRDLVCNIRNDREHHSDFFSVTQTCPSDVSSRKQCDSQVLK